MKIFDFKKILLISTLGVMISCSQKSSQEHIDLARQYIEQGDNAAAIVELKNAVQREPKLALARFELGKLYLSNKQYESAEKELNRALEYGHSAAEVIPLISQSYKHTGAYVALSKVDEKQEGLSNDEKSQVGYLKLLSLSKLDKLEEARNLVADLSAVESDSVYKGLTLAYTSVIDGDYQQALNDVTQLRIKNPDNEDVLKLQGQLYLQLRQPEEAAQVYQDYVQLYPNDTETLFILANLLLEQGKTAEAEPHVDALLAISSENALLNRLKALIRVADKDYPQAQSYAEKAINSGSADPVLRLIAGYAAFQQQNFEDAHQHLSFIASSIPDNHPALRLLAASQLKLGLSLEASDVLERLNQLTEKDALLLSKAGYELIRAGHVKAAKDIIEKTSEISRSAEDLTRLGVLQLSLNNVEGIINLEHALEKSPELSNTKITLATAYMATNQFDKALQLAADWKQSDPTDTKPFMLAGEAYLKQKNFTDAKGEFEQSLALDENNSMAKMALLNMDFMQGNMEQGTQALNSLLKQQPNFAPALAANYLLKKRENKSEEGLQPVIDAQQSAPDNLELRFLLARLYLAEKNYSKVLELMQSVDENAEPPGQYWLIKGQALLRSNQVSEAEKHYDLWLEQSAYNKPALLGKLLLLDTQSKFSEGLELTNTFLTERDDVQMQMLRTHFLLMMNKYTEAQQAFDSLPEKSYELPLVKGFLARLQLAQKDPAGALPNAKAAFEAVPNNRNLTLLLQCYEQSGQSEQGFELLEQHVASYPQNLVAKMLLAERQINKDQSAAISTYEESLELNPDNYVVLNNLAFLYLQEGKMELAKKHASRAVELKPDNAATLDTLAQVIVAQGDYPEALKYYERAATNRNLNEEIYLNYVETLFNAKQNKLAMRKLEQREMTLPESVARVAELKTKFGI